MDRKPTVSIALPVRNGELYLPDTLRSLLNQSFRDFELIVSDNASTDKTWAICQDFAAADPRLRLFRQRENIGGPANWNFVLQKARGTYLKWSAANDLCHPLYVERCEAVLRDDPGAVLCHARTAIIDEAGRLVRRHERDLELLQSTPVGRLKAYLNGEGLNNAHQGLIRISALEMTGLERNYENGDLPLMAELALLGRWRLVSEYLFFRRMAPKTHMAWLTPAERGQLFYSHASPIYLPNVRPFIGYLVAALRVPMPVSQKFQAIKLLLRYGYWKRRILVGDLFRLIRQPSDP